jgi:hypothetical protein
MTITMVRPCVTLRCMVSMDVCRLCCTVLVARGTDSILNIWLSVPARTYRSNRQGSSSNRIRVLIKDALEVSSELLEDQPFSQSDDNTATASIVVVDHVFDAVLQGRLCSVD